MPKTSGRSQIEDKKPAGREPARFGCFGIQTANWSRSISPGSPPINSIMSFRAVSLGSQYR
jgi:hypothetical protein